MDELLRYQIGMTLIKSIGDISAKNLIAYVGSAEGVFKENKRTLMLIPGITETKVNEILNPEVLLRADREVEFIIKNKISTYYFAEKDYSYRLKECLDAPIMQYGKGNLNLNEGKFVGVVGTRKPSEEGKEYCQQLVKDLALQNPNITIVSGLAYGIDITAHKAALEAGLPTIGIPAHGLDRLYPETHRSTALKMIEKGGILTEFVTETRPERFNFVVRNRIIAGMCDAVIVVESPKGGGSLITSKYANSYNRDVFTFPGRPTDKNFEGCNTLIKRNEAALIENAHDVIKFMGWENSNKKKQTPEFDLFSELSDIEQILIQLLRTKPDGIHTDELIQLTQKPFHQISSILLEMEFKGLVKPIPGGAYRIVK